MTWMLKALNVKPLLCHADDFTIVASFVSVKITSQTEAADEMRNELYHTTKSGLAFVYLRLLLIRGPCVSR